MKDENGRSVESINDEGRKTRSWFLPSSFILHPSSFAFDLGIKRNLEQFGAWLMAFGSLGLFAIALLDSALIPLPSGPDLIMITLSAVEPAWMPVYALAATAGSTIGCLLLYLAARRAGLRVLGRIKPERRERLENLLGRYDMLAIMLPAVLPPPFPFKPFVLSAGVFKLKTARFVTAIFIGRAVRFLIEGWLAIQFGRDAERIIRQHGLKVLIVIAVIFIVSLAVKFYRLRSRRSTPLAVDEIQTPE
jgi:membrane protein YqaA with SNARE-associated domain